MVSGIFYRHRRAGSGSEPKCWFSAPRKDQNRWNSPKTLKILFLITKKSLNHLTVPEYYRNTIMLKYQSKAKFVVRTWYQSTFTDQFQTNRSRSSEGVRGSKFCSMMILLRIFSGEDHSMLPKDFTVVLSPSIVSQIHFCSKFIKWGEPP